MSAYRVVKCPACHKTLGEGFWVSTHLSFKMHCRCKRVVEIRHDYTVRILQEQPQPAFQGNKRS